MAEDSWWWTTDGVGDGTNAGYTAVEIAQFWRYLLTQDPTTQCVVAGALNELAVTGTTSPVSMATGYAIVDGTGYINDAAKDVAVGTPVVGTTGHRVVLRATWGATQETRVKLLSSADGVAAIPAVTQTSGTLYEVSLATLTITTGGAITVTNTRGFCHFGTDVETAMIEASAVTLAKMAANSVDSDQYVDGSIDAAHIATDAVETAKIKAANITLAKMAANSVDSAQYVDASIDTAHLSADSVDDTKCGNRVPQLYRRQGGSATVWNTAGSTDRTPTTVRMVCGSILCANTATVTFPITFSDIPLVVISPFNPTAAIVAITAIAADQFSCVSSDHAGSDDTVDMYWIAIGPE